MTDKATPFPSAARRERGYDRAAVDAFLLRARSAFEGAEGAGGALMSSEDVRAVAFPLTADGYAIANVDAALGRIEDAFAAREREVALASHGAEDWVAEARSAAQEILDRLSRPKHRRFDRVGPLRFGYRADEVDIVGDKLVRFFESGEPVSVEQVRAVAFRMQRGGYREEQVDALLDAVVDVMLAVR